MRIDEFPFVTGLNFKELSIIYFLHRVNLAVLNYLKNRIKAF